jgi:hypothetical protein
MEGEVKDISAQANGGASSMSPNKRQKISSESTTASELATGMTGLKETNAMTGSGSSLQSSPSLSELPSSIMENPWKVHKLAPPVSDDEPDYLRMILTANVYGEC